MTCSWNVVAMGGLNFDPELPAISGLLGQLVARAGPVCG